MSAPASSIDAFLGTGWSDHGERPQDVADRIAASLHFVQAPEHFAPFTGLLVHVYGEHLGQWQRGVELLESLRGMPAFDGSAAAAGPIARGVATLRYAGGATEALEALCAEDQVRVLATAASALAARQDFERAIDAFDQALRIAQAGLPAGSPGYRALAVGGNNLAVALEGRPERSASETRAMLTSAQAGLTYWKLAGTWLEEERAEYRLARSLVYAGEAPAAVGNANRCLALCEQHDAPPFEKFFAHAVLALAHRAAGDAALFEHHRSLARDLSAQLPPEEKPACESDLRELG